MNATKKLTTRLTWISGIAMTVVLALFVSSNHRLLEECSQEVVSHESEVILNRSDDERRAHREVAPIQSRPTRLTRRLNVVRTGISIVVVEERDRLNGLGTHLLI